VTTAVQVERLSIRVAADGEGLRQAARELFEKEFHAEADAMVRKNAAEAANAEAVLASLPERTTMPDGYYLRVNYLLDLDAMLESGIQIPAKEITRDEFAGLQAVRNGRAEFENEHPRCASCGERNERMAMSCRKCGKEIKH
jgi:hypothetical protein